MDRDANILFREPGYGQSFQSWILALLLFSAIDWFALTWLAPALF